MYPIDFLNPGTRLNLKPCNRVLGVDGLIICGRACIILCFVLERVFFIEIQ